MEKMLKKVYENKRLYKTLLAISKIITVLTVLAYGLLLFGAAGISADSLLRVISLSALPFVAVSLIRRAVGAKRPYELYSFYENAPKKKGGASFPSRHAFSVFLIATAMLFIYPAAGVILLVLGAVLCVARVLLGIHFIRDVISGAAVGVISAILGVIIFAPF